MRYLVDTFINPILRRNIMGRIVIISDKDMVAAGWTHKQELVRPGFICDYCGGRDHDCQDCGGRGNGFDEYRDYYVKGDVVLVTTDPDKFVSSCKPGGPAEQRLSELGILDLPHRFC
jgi:hypothetical protein